jgi:ribosomal protein L11 methyltransferase
LNWLEVSTTVNGELAEAIAELFSRFAPGGVTIEGLRIEDDAFGESAVEMVIVRAYLPVDNQLELGKRRIEEGLWHLSQIHPLPRPSFRLIEEEDWSQAWKSHYRPIPIGKRLMILPAWSPSPSGDRLHVILNPGMAFGTGTHPTTRLCLIALEDYLHSGERVIDLGCGSGILSIAAARLGAVYVQAWDNDIKAVDAARENVRLNHLTRCITVEAGSLSELLKKCEQIDHKADLLIANITAPVLEDMIMTGLARAVKDGGIVILSGILAPQVESLSATCELNGFTYLKTLMEEDWRALVYRVGK